MSKQSSLIVIVIILVGYVAIFSTTVFGDSHQIQRLSSEVIAARMQVEILKKSLMATEQELRISRQKETKLLESEKNTNLQIVNVPQVAIGRQSVRPGVIILGMHRSATSLVGGLINKMGLKTGGPLIEAAEDNAKGFFERIDVVQTD